MSKPSVRRAYPIDLNGLKQNIAAFRQVLKSDTYDPAPLAHSLYRALFLQLSKRRTTLEADLRAYGARTLMWSLDSVLRYIPPAALHDGRNYLVARYRNVVFDITSDTRLLHTSGADWLALGLGVSKAYPGFQALAGVPKELHAIIREDSAAGSGGVLHGAIRMDERFTRKALIDGLHEGFRVVHVASHFSYDVVNEDASFLLLGDGDHLSLSEMRDLPEVFESVELLTLSACDTATGGADGKEVEGLGYVAQKLGAKSVVASLWPVSDEGTEVLMREFYSIKSLNPRMSKAEAFQRAQLALIGGVQTTASDEEQLRKPVVFQKEIGRGAFFKRDPNPRFAHPHYWAPFILIGNWK